MRARQRGGPLAVQAVSGTDTVMLGMDLDPKLAAEVLGFAIRRTDTGTGKHYWLRNMLAFPINDDPAVHSYSSWNNPIQTFRWGDYTAAPGQGYVYTVRALGGSPERIVKLAEQSVSIGTETFAAGDHGVEFNRGVIESQYYADRFGNRQPSDVGDRAAYTWLSAGLEEAILGFIGRAVDASWALRAAVYEFSYPPVLAAFASAAAAGADVRIISDTTGKAEPRTTNAAAIAAAGIGDLMVPRSHIAIAHNKFIVAIREGTPVAVWTGSTNLTEGGIFGQANVGHEVRDRIVATHYLRAWNRIAANPMQAVIKPQNDSRPTMPIRRLARRTTTVFSPRSTVAALDWYADLAAKASSGVFLTAAFGVSKQFLDVLTQQRDYLRYVLMDTNTGGAMLTIRDADPDNRVTVGATIPAGGFGQWVKEVTLTANRHVRYVHTKVLLIDPFGNDPVVVSGSANFSIASTTANDENMLVTRGDQRVADIYLNEFMRLFTHYEFRASITGDRGGSGAVSRGRRRLDPTPHWAARWYAAGSSREKERRMFAGTG